MSYIDNLLKIVVDDATARSNEAMESSNVEVEGIIDSVLDKAIGAGNSRIAESRTLEEEIELLRDDDDTNSLPSRGPSSFDVWRLGNYTFTETSEIAICGRRFNVERKSLNETEIHRINRPSLKYRQREGDQLSSTIIYEEGYDRNQPILLARGEGLEEYIIDGDWRYIQLVNGLKDGKMKISTSFDRSGFSNGVRTEPPIPALCLCGKVTTKEERLAISIALNTSAVSQMKPLELGDVILSLDAFIRSTYQDVNEMTSSDLLEKVIQISSECMAVELLHVFIDNNTAHNDLIQKWTLENTSAQTSTQEEVNRMNILEAYMVYVKAAICFVNCPEAFSHAFGKKGRELPRSSFECQWTLSLFTETRFIRLTDSRKTLLLLTLLSRQVKWGIPNIPYTSMSDVRNIIQLADDILNTARGCINKKVLRITRIQDIILQNAIITNHPDDSVKEGPYIRSILFFLTNWKSNSRKFSMQAILKEVEHDMKRWPRKRTWRSTESQEYTTESDLMTVIDREMYASESRKLSKGTKRNIKAQKGNRTKKRKQRFEESVGQQVLTALEDENAFENLMDMGKKLGASRAVKTFTRRTVEPSNDESLHLGDSEGTVETDEQPMVPLSTVVEWFGKQKKRSRKKIASRESSSSCEDLPEFSESSDSERELAVERHSILTSEDTKKVAKILELDMDPIIDTLLPIFKNNSMWAHYVTKNDIEGIELDFKLFAIQQMSSGGNPADKIEYHESRVDKDFCDDVLTECFKKISSQKLRADGFLSLPSFFHDTSSDWIEEYMNHFSKDFGEHGENSKYWKPIITSFKNEKEGRLQVFNDKEVFRDIVKNSSVLQSKILVEVKMGMALHYFTEDFNLNMDDLGSHFIAGTEKGEGSTPIYNHEIGRYFDSPRRKKTEFVPFQLIATANSTVVVKVQINSHFHPVVPMTNREKHCDRFVWKLLLVRPFSLLIIRGNMLHSFLPSRLADEFSEMPWFALRWFAYEEDYDDEDDASASFTTETTRSSEEIDDEEELDMELDNLKVDAHARNTENTEKDKLKGTNTTSNQEGAIKSLSNKVSSKVPTADQPSGKTVKGKKGMKQPKKFPSGQNPSTSKLKADKSASSSSEYPSVENSSMEEEDESSEEDGRENERPTKGRKGLSAIRPTLQTTRGRTYLQERSERTIGKVAVEKQQAESSKERQSSPAKAGSEKDSVRKK